MCRGILRCGILFFILWGITFRLSAQGSSLHFVSPMQSFKADVKFGSAQMVSGVPEKYWKLLNSVNVPVDQPGVNLSLFTRKAITGHFEFGYQANYLALYGDVTQQSVVYRVHTQVLENSYHFCFNLFRTDLYRPINNCFIYYKMGFVTLKNDPRLRLPDGSTQEIPKAEAQKFYFSNGVTAATGVGVGYNRQLTPNFGVVGTFEFTRCSDSFADLYKIDKIFYNSSNTFDQYMALSVGLSWTFDLVKPNNERGKYFRARSETEKRLQEAKIARQKKRMLRVW